MTATFDAVAMPASVCLALFEAIEAGAAPSSLAVFWRDGGASVVDRGILAGRLRRAGRTALAQKCLRAAVPKGRILVVASLARGENVTLGTLPTRPAPVVAPAPAPEAVLVAHRPRAAVPRPRAQARGRYLQDLKAITASPGVPSGNKRVAP